MKAWALVLNGNRGKLYKKAKYEGCVLRIKKGFRNWFNCYIPDKCKPIELEHKRGTIPLFLVNEKTVTALLMLENVEKIEANPDKSLKKAINKLKKQLGLKTIVSIEMKEKTDVDAHTKMNLLSKGEFWKRVAEKIKLSNKELIIYLGAGYGFFRLIEWFLMYAFSGGY